MDEQDIERRLNQTDQRLVELETLHDRLNDSIQQAHDFMLRLEQRVAELERLARGS